MHVAHSSVVRGAGVVAGGPYYCAQGSVFAAYYHCLDPGFFGPLPATAVLKAQTEAFAAAHRIDATSHLAGSRAWLFSGSQDTTVASSVVEALNAYYGQYKVHTAFVREPAGHGMVTTDYGNPCGTTAAPYLNDCDYDAAGEILNFLLGPLEAPSSAPTGRVVEFDQKPFADGSPYAISLADAGFVYIPRACETDRCRIHVAFHGCRQEADVVGKAFVLHAGYNRWADTNHLIVLYPQTIARYLWLFNPRGCWDWWGYTGPDYATRSAPQMRAVMGMIERLGR